VLILFGDAESEQLSSDGRNYYKIVEGKKYVVANSLPNFQRIPFLDYGERVPELYAQVGKFPEKLVQQIKGIKGGSYTHYLRNRLCGVELKVPITANSQDRISLDAASGAFPLYSLNTNQAQKVIQANYYSTLDYQRGDYRKFSADLKLASGSEAQVGMEASDGAVLIKPAGPISPMNIIFEARINGSTMRSRLTYTPNAVGELIALRPLDWTSSMNQIVVERFTGLDGTLLDRLLIPAQPY
jgi:hypothetical protein